MFSWSTISNVYLGTPFQARVGKVTETPCKLISMPTEFYSGQVRRTSHRFPTLSNGKARHPRFQRVPVESQGGPVLRVDNTHTHNTRTTRKEKVMAGFEGHGLVQHATQFITELHNHTRTYMGVAAFGRFFTRWLETLSSAPITCDHQTHTTSNIKRI